MPRPRIQHGALAAAATTDLTPDGPIDRLWVASGERYDVFGQKPANSLGMVPGHWPGPFFMQGGSAHHKE